MQSKQIQKSRWGAVGMLWRREIVRFYRQPSRVIAVILSPFLFWFLIGSGVGRSFSGGEENYLTYFFPGAILLVILFAAVFSTISIIEDRREGFLQAVIASPVFRASIPLGKILGSTTLACFQTALFIVMAWVTGIRFETANPLEVAAAVFLASLLFSTLGFLMAWQFRSVQGFHGVMNILLMPMWFLSGALFSSEGAAGWIQFLMAINPLYYGHQFLSASFGVSEMSGFGSAVIMLVSILVLWGIAAVQVAKKNGLDS